MAACPGILIALCQAEIDNVDYMLLFLDAYQEIIGFDIPMQKSVLMNKFNSLEHLYCQHEHGFQREFAAAIFE